MASPDIALLETFQKHVEDMRNLSLCKICIKPFYEPFILACGHTYCYSCLASWFGGAPGRRKKKNCPDCRAEVKVQPSPNYLLRDFVHMFINRVELLPEDETVQEHQQAKEEEAVLLAADRAGAGLFKGVFRRDLHPIFRHGIMDHEDGVLRCPECNWEMEDGECLHCGFHDDYADGDSEISGMDTGSDSDDLGSDVESDTGRNRGHLERVMDRLARRAFGEDPYDSEGDVPSPYADYYDDEDNMYRFIDDDDEDEDEDDLELDEDDFSGSESTMTNYHRGLVQGERRGYDMHEAAGAAGDVPGGLGQYPGRPSEVSTPVHGELSDVNTNYDETTDASEGENQYPIFHRHRPRHVPVVLSDDDEEDQDEENNTEGEGEEILTEASVDDDEDEEDEDDGEAHQGTETSEQSGTENEDEGEEEEGSDSDSDVRPPQPSTRRMQHLQSQRARRDHPRSQPHTHGERRPISPPVGSGAMPQNHLHQRRTGRHSGSHRHPYDRSAHGPRRIPVGGGISWMLN